MSRPEEFYANRLDLLNEQYTAVRKKLRNLSLFRLFVFLAGCFLIYYNWGNTRIVLPVVLITFAIFLFMIRKYSDISYSKNFYKKLIHINATETEVLIGKFDVLPTGAEFSDPMHDFSHDIDLFGRGSFFQYLNRTATSEGKNYLAALLKGNDTENIKRKQQAIHELAEIPEWRQEFQAHAALLETEVSAEMVGDWILNHTISLASFTKWIPVIFSIFSFGIITAVILDILSVNYFTYWFIGGLLLAGLFVKRVNKLSQFASKAQSTLQQYSKLIQMIENRSFSTPLLQELQHQLKNDQTSAYNSLNTLSKRVDALDQRNNLIVAILGNSLLQLDLFNAYRLERWIESNRIHIKDWFDTIAFFDAYASFGNYTFNHPEHHFPEITETETIQAVGLGHPLIATSKLVKNDLTIHTGEFMVITGANMAGKSTFLRTVSLFIVMANNGLPVCAEKSVYKPIKLITSMRTADSLNEDASYFYAELKRLKHIVSNMEDHEYFIILDEILKGTNSKDKAIGSRKFVEKLTRSGSTGIIATHDLSLCEIADEYEQVNNYFFDAVIKEDELFFDYRLRPGICTNMNASFLLRKMGIV
ncbi:MutS-related protein [Robertkochia solimangrovi]|uniref:MutS-related protein n=1 Tax=Robertkochia solimangrovi TaxID=2213046 RepID=UPI0011807707|nr:DNA mismatch repair protein MutS [Robertkochia solimangrovi]TRZ46299.1 DNA mismatch repair protein MutS [Robertkochia solimangrovi]